MNGRWGAVPVDQDGQIPMKPEHRGQFPGVVGHS